MSVIQAASCSYLFVVDILDTVFIDTIFFHPQVVCGLLAYWSVRTVSSPALKLKTTAGTAPALSSEFLSIHERAKSG
jgi:hypothetical protein